MYKNGFAKLNTHLKLRQHRIETEVLKMFAYMICGFLALQVSQASPASRIVNGDNANYGKHRWQVSLQYKDATSPSGFTHICGAVIVNPYWLLTAAHCVDFDNLMESFEMVVGKHTMSTEMETNLQRITPHNVFLHPAWDSDNIANDIALIRLEKPVEYGEHNVKSVSLPPHEGKIDEYIGQYCYITGWGRLEGDGDLPEILQEAPTNIPTNAECRSRLGLTGFFYLKNFNVCVFTGYSGSCNGDSGGPLVCGMNGLDVGYEEQDWQLVGLTSWGLQGCPVDSPSVYTRVTFYYEWIHNTINEN